MWAQYRTTFLRIQAVILVVTCAAFVAAGYRLPAAAVFFTVMQLGAIMGAMWGVRIKGTLELRTHARARACAGQ
jgi:uncharacterized membrane protein YphA (DoxX/SURF4 family)